MLTPFELALVAHLIADWLLQNDWMARNKTSLLHPAAWVHASIYGICLAMVLGWPAGAVLGLIHLLVDTKIPLNWWIRIFKKCSHAPEASQIAIWTDQVIHIVTFAAWLAFIPQ